MDARRVVVLSKVRFGRRRAGLALFGAGVAYVDYRSRRYWGPRLYMR